MANIAEGPLTSLAFCWRLERRDGAGVALTSHDRAIERDDVRYTPAPGMIPAAIVRQRGLEAHSSEVDGAVSDQALTDDDLALGRWDGARVSLFAADWEGRDGEIPLAGGEIGPVSIKGDGFTAELVGNAARLDAPVCPDTSSECRATLGDRRCRVDMSGRRLSAIVVDHDGASLSLDPAPDDRFAGGQLTIVSGDMSGFRTAVLGVDEATVELRDIPRRTVETGTRVWVSEGCDKTFATCRQRFANAANFRGEPHLPGNDLLTRYPGA